jgi:hypothetical protein
MTRQMHSNVRTRFLIVGTYRCGTSAIVEALGRHPDVLCGMEWTHHVPPWCKISVARAALLGDFSQLPRKPREKMRAIAADSKRAIGFKCLFRSSNLWVVRPRLSPALWADRLEAHLRWLRGDPAIHLIHVVRLDNVAWLRSKALSDASGRFAGSQYPDDLNLSIRVGEARRRVATKLWIDGRLKTLKTTNSYLRVNYEAFVADNVGVARQMAAFLGCDPDRLPAGELRHQPQSGTTRAGIANAGELREALGPLVRLPDESQHRVPNTDREQDPP